MAPPLLASLRASITALPPSLTPPRIQTTPSFYYVRRPRQDPPPPTPSEPCRITVAGVLLFPLHPPRLFLPCCTRHPARATFHAETLRLGHRPKKSQGARRVSLRGRRRCRSVCRPRWRAAVNRLFRGKLRLSPSHKTALGCGDFLRRRAAQRLQGSPSEARSFPRDALNRNLRRLNTCGIQLSPRSSHPDSRLACLPGSPVLAPAHRRDVGQSVCGTASAENVRKTTKKRWAGKEV